MNDEAITTGSYRIPRLEHARVADAMRHGLLSCPADASLRAAARTMSTQHVHMILATDPADGSPVGALSDQGLLRAVLEHRNDDPELGEVVERDMDTISSAEPLAEAIELMRERGTSHLIVRDAQTGRPSGVLSTLDIAGVLAWGEA